MKVNHLKRVLLIQEVLVLTELEQKSFSCGTIPSAQFHSSQNFKPVERRVRRLKPRRNTPEPQLQQRHCAAKLAHLISPSCFRTKMKHFEQPL